MIQRGQVLELGNHRLMCGDAGDSDDVACLFGEVTPDLVFTSPPYAQQRTYVSGIGIGDWDVMMRRVFGAMPHHDKTQVLVNLGLVHRKGEWQPYWDGWIEWMRAQGWRRFGWYVWDKGCGFPLDPRNGRPNQAFEFLFHFHRRARPINKTLPCKTADRAHPSAKSGGIAVRKGKNTRAWSHAGRLTQPTKTPDDIWRISRHKSGGIDHPAVFPIALPVAIHAAYTDTGEIVYDPFVGSGTSLLAAEQQGRVCYAMEIEPSYCDIAVQRWESRRK